MGNLRTWAILAGFLAMTAMAGAQVFTVEGRQLSAYECQALVGGETWVDIDADRTVARVTTIPRDSHGMDYSRANCYSVAVHNRVTTKVQVGNGDFYSPAGFPEGSAQMSVRAIPDPVRQEKYGSSSGKWIATDATRKVTAYPAGAGGKADMGSPYTRFDAGYFWHANNASSFAESKSAGCLISPKADLDRVIGTLEADIGTKRIRVY